MSIRVPRLDRKTIAKIAALAGVDPRTVEGLIKGRKRTLEPIAEAIRATMRSMGLEVRP